MTFIDELLLEAEQAEREQKIKMDKLRADQILQAIGILEQKADEINQLADKEIELIEEFRNTEFEKLNKKVSWLAYNLEQYMRSSGEKTINLPHGQLKVRLGRDKVEVNDMDMFLKIADKRGFLKTIPETFEPNLPLVLEYIKRTGEIPKGINLIPAQTKFSYTTKKGEQSEQREQTKGRTSVERASEVETVEG